MIGTVYYSPSPISNFATATYTATAGSMPLDIGTHALTAVYNAGTDDPYASSTSDELDQEIDPDFSVTGPGWTTPGVTDPVYAAAVIPDASNDTSGGTMTFTLSQGDDTIDTQTATLTAGAARPQFDDSLSAGTYTLTVSYASSDTDDYADCVFTWTLFVSAAPTAESGVETSGTTQGLTFSPSGSTDSTTYYDWTATTMPSGASAPTFSDDDDASASSTIATFSQAGDYTIVVTEADSSGVVETATFPVTVDQSLTAIAVTGPSPTVAVGDSEPVSATGYDQFGNAMTGLTFTWGVVGAGSCESGIYYAPTMFRI